MAEVTEIPDPENLEATASSHGLIGKFKAFAVVGFIVLAQCGAAILLLPTAEQTAAMAHSHQAMQAANDSGEAPNELPVDPGKPMQEFDLGEFSVSAYQPLSNTTLRIDFHLYGTVEASELAQVTQELEKHRNRIREDVIVTVRGSNIEDLTDAGLGLIKRRILDKTNRRLGKPYFKSVIFSDFSFLEQ